MVEYILVHRGPDGEGRAHPKNKRPRLELLEEALTLARERGLAADVRPYHFKSVPGIWQQGSYAHEVVAKRIARLLRDKYGGSLVRLITEGNQDELRGQLDDVIENRAVSVGVAAAANRFANSPATMVRVYLQWAGTDENKLKERFANLRPWHFAVVSRGTFDDIAVCRELVGLKIQQLLERKYKGSLVQLIATTNRAELLGPYEDTLDGEPVRVSVASAAQRFQGSLVAMVRAYLAWAGTEENQLAQRFANLRSWHFARVGNGTFTDAASCTELVTLKIEQLLERKYQGSLVRLIVGTNVKELNSPYEDVLDGKPVHVSVLAATGHFRNSPESIVRAYLTSAATTENRLAERFANLRPWHFAVAAQGTFDDLAVCKELMSLKIGQLLARKYHGSLVRLIAETDAKELGSPYEDTLDGVQVSVSVGAAANRLHNSPAAMIRAYLERTATEANRLVERFANLRSWHFATAAPGTFDDVAVCRELVGRKVEQLLEQKYEGSLVRLITETNTDELRSPYEDTLDAEPVSVSLSVATSRFGGNLELIQAYLDWAGIDENRLAARFANLKSWHFATAGMGTFDDIAACRELVGRKVEQLLEQKYEGRLVRLITHTNLAELLEPYQDILDGEPVSVGLGTAAKRFQDSPELLVRAYLEWAQTDENKLAQRFANLRPWHFGDAAKGTFSDLAVCSELIGLKIEQLLERKYQGSLVRLITQTSVAELMEPYIDVLDGEPVEVSVGAAVKPFQGSPELLVRAYLAWAQTDENQLAQRFSNLKPWHFATAGKGTFGETDACLELLGLKIGQLLERKYAGDLKRLLAETGQKELLEPYEDVLDGEPVSVSVSMAAHRFQNSPFDILKAYHDFHGYPFPYTRLCFVGSAETRQRRISGDLSRSDFKRIRAEDGSYDTALLGYTQYDSSEKRVARELKFEVAAQFIEATPVRYLGLETERLRSLRMIADLLDLDSSGSVVVEKSARIFNTLAALKAHGNQRNRALLAGVELLKDDVNQFIVRGDCAGRGFNLVNLDYLGQLSKGKQAAVEGLFRHDALAERAVLIVTLGNSPLDQNRAERAGFVGTQFEALRAIVTATATTHRYTLADSQEIRYRGGTKADSSRGSEMLVGVFAVGREGTDGARF